MIDEETVTGTLQNYLNSLGLKSELMFSRLLMNQARLRLAFACQPAFYVLKANLFDAKERERERKTSVCSICCQLKDRVA